VRGQRTTTGQARNKEAVGGVRLRRYGFGQPLYSYALQQVDA